ncbi:serine hydrolase domain-containing protein [Undibacterium sp. JH2W]|uniref:serine hydrolase domain-containing protein n=1 Tax=Undibacterium sp. JH2W TaxID=3413037 RepID=UPI003BF2E91B
MRLRRALPLIVSLAVAGPAFAQTGVSAASAALAPAVEAQLKSRLQEIFKTACSKDEFSGAYLVARGGQIISEAACGEASKRYHVANTLETRFNVASIGKMFTAVAIGQLAEAGRLSYGDTVDKYLDASWVPPEVAQKITIGQLLSHTSGLGNIFTDKFFNSPYMQLTALRSLDGYKAFTREARLEFAPGSNYLYSNLGMLLLGGVIEKASGQKYDDYLRQHVFQVAGMSSTDNYVRDESLENLATGYMGAAASTKENTFFMPLRGEGYGAGYSSVHDLLGFSQALEAGKLLKPETRQLFWQDQTAGRADKGSYGYGFELSKGVLGKVVGHSGQMPGVYGKLDMYLDAGYTVVVLSNYEPGYLPLAGRIATVLESFPGKTGQ